MIDLNHADYILHSYNRGECHLLIKLRLQIQFYFIHKPRILVAEDGVYLSVATNWLSKYTELIMGGILIEKFSRMVWYTPSKGLCIACHKKFDVNVVISTNSIDDNHK